MNNRTVLRIAFATLAVVGISSSIAKADTGWTILPSQSPVSFTGLMGDAVWNYADGSLGGTTGVSDNAGNPLWIQQYAAVAQHQNDNNPITSPPDPNFGTYAGFNNSLATQGSGSF